MLLIKISKKGKVTNIEKTDINFIKKNKHISKLNQWNYNNCDFVLYGCENGNAGEENKYDLPPPVDCELYFNDLYFIKLNQNKIEDLSIQEYNIFYNESFGGFEDIQYTDEDEDEEENSLSEHTSDRDFINDDDISINSITNDIDLSELSDFTSDEDYTDNEKISPEDNVSELSSIEITVSSCDEDEDEEEEEDDENDTTIDDLDNIEDDLDVNTE